MDWSGFRRFGIFLVLGASVLPSTVISSAYLLYRVYSAVAGNQSAYPPSERINVQVLWPPLFHPRQCHQCVFPYPLPSNVFLTGDSHVGTLCTLKRPSVQEFTQVCILVSIAIFNHFPTLTVNLSSGTSNRPSKQAECPIQGCGRKLSRKGDLPRHMESKHPEHLDYEYETQSFSIFLPV